MNRNNEIKNIYRICGRKLAMVILLPSIIIGLVGTIFMLFGYEMVLYAMVVTIVGSLAGGVVIGLVSRRWYEYIIQGVQAAMAGRLFVTVAGLLICVFVMNIRERGFFLFTAGFYIVGLFVETSIVVKLVRERLLEQKDKSKICFFADK